MAKWCFSHKMCKVALLSTVKQHFIVTALTTNNIDTCMDMTSSKSSACNPDSSDSRYVRKRLSTKLLLLHQRLENASLMR